MPSRFFKLPLSAQLKLIQTLDYNGVFNLSLCSQRVYKIIKRVHFHGVERIKYVLAPNRLSVLIEDVDQEEEFMATVARLPMTLGKEYALHLGSMKINFCYEIDNRDLNSYYVLYYNEISPEICHDSLVEHIFGIIGKPSRILLEIDGQEDWTPSLFIEGVREIVLKPDNVDANLFEYVKFFPNLKCLLIKNELRTAPTFPHIPNMFVSRSGHFASSIMQNFTGERLVLYEADCNNECILEFLQKWINGDVEADYVFVKSGKKRPIFNPEDLLAKIETDVWNPRMRPGKYTLILNYGPCWKDKREINTEQYRDVRRKFDGKIASFLITPEFFAFHSWETPSRFFKLPLSAQLKLIQTLDYHGVFNLSLCSQRVSKVIKRVNFSRVERIQYVFAPNRMHVLIEDIDQQEEVMATVARIGRTLDKPYALQLGSMKINFYYKKCNRGLNSYYALYYNEISSEICHESLVEHIIGIIGKPSRILLEVDGRGNWNSTLVIEGVNETILNRNNIDANILEYVKLYSNLECLVIRGKLETTPVLPSIPNMVVLMSEGFASFIMQNFSGKRLSLYEADCNNQCILDFLQKWISGAVEADHVFVKSDDKRQIFNPEELLAAITTEKWNPNLRPGNYTYTYNYGPCWKKSHTVNTERYRDIRRKKDRKFASFLITPEFFVFYSWKRSIGFFRFPFLVQLEIIRNLKYTDTFVLSLCSKEAFKRIKCVNFTAMEKIRYIVVKDDFQVRITNKDKSRHYIASVSKQIEPCKNNNALRIGPVEKIFDFDRLKTNHGTWGGLFYNDGIVDLVREALVEHVTNLLRKSPPIQLLVHVDQDSNTPLHIGGVTDIAFDGSEVDGKFFDYVRTYQNLNSLMVKAKMRIAPEFSNVTNLYCKEAAGFSHSIVQSFTGLRLCLSNCECNNNTILEFLRKWINGDSDLELLTLKSKNSQRIFNENAVLAEIETQPWDLNNRPKIYRMALKVGDYYHSKSINTEFYRDIQRASDGKFASFKTSRTRFSFFVWV